MDYLAPNMGLQLTLTGTIYRLDYSLTVFQLMVNLQPHQNGHLAAQLNKSQDTDQEKVVRRNLLISRNMKPHLIFCFAVLPLSNVT